MEIEHYIAELIQNASIMYSLFFLLSLIFYSKRIYTNRNNIYIKLFLGLLGGTIVSLIYYFNRSSQSQILVLIGMLAILLTSYLYKSYLSSSIIILTMVFNRLIFNMESISIIVLAYAVLTIIVNTIAYKFKRTRVSWYVSTIIALVFYIIVAVILGENPIHIILSTILTFFISITIYMAIVFIEDSNKMYYAYYKYSSKDYLTKLYNRRKLELDILLLEEKTNHKLSVAFIDVDNFKTINDTYGHNAGDFVLKTIADFIISKRLNYMSGYRLSGEEFCVIFKGHSLESHTNIIETIQNEIKEFIFTTIIDNREIDFNVTVSIGLVHNKTRSHNIREIIARADQLMYKAKESGKNRLIEDTLE